MKLSLICTSQPESNKYDDIDSQHSNSGREVLAEPEGKSPADIAHCVQARSSGASQEVKGGLVPGPESRLVGKNS